MYTQDENDILLDGECIITCHRMDGEQYYTAAIARAEKLTEFLNNLPEIEKLLS